MRGPTLQRSPAFVEVQGFVIDLRDTGFERANVAEDLLDDVWENTEALVQRRRKRAAKIVQVPVEPLSCDSQTSIDVDLAAAPVLKPTIGTTTEDVVASLTPRLRFQ